MEILALISSIAGAVLSTIGVMGLLYRFGVLS